MPSDSDTAVLSHANGRAPDGLASLGDRLVQAGHLTADELHLAVHEQRRRGEPLTKILVDFHFIAPELLSEFLGQQADTRSISLKGFQIPPPLLTLVPCELARQVTTVPVSRENGVLTVALADPLNLTAIDTLQRATGLRIDVLAAPERDIRQCLEANYRTADTMGATIDEALEQKNQEPALPLEEVLSRRGNQEKGAPIIRLVSQIISSAVNTGASDIHFEPEEHMLRIRKRIDGVLQQDVLIPKAMRSAVISRMKILADLDLAETGAPQDGRANVLVADRPISLRVSSLPTRFGENIVARILDPEAQVLTLPALGFAPDTLEQFREAINRPYGVVLVTGPTGSGKSTTLYAALKEISTMDVSTFTLEDPIEYVMPLVRQTQIKEERGLTFSAGLRALLRQDPDIILVGETRDTETAQLMVRAALTGHLVLSTLHTNSAPETVTRLLDMGLEPFNVASALNLVVAQRLVRRVCARCKQQYEPSDEELAGAKVARETTLGDLRFTTEALEDAAAKASREAQPHLKGLSLDTRVGQLPFFRGRGCDECGGQGLKGRQGLYEVMAMTPAIRRLILQNGSGQELKDAAVADGMLTLRMDGWLKVLKGIVPLEQVIRETAAS